MIFLKISFSVLAGLHSKKKILITNEQIDFLFNHVDDSRLYLLALQSVRIVRTISSLIIFVIYSEYHKHITKRFQSRVSKMKNEFFFKLTF